MFNILCGVILGFGAGLFCGLVSMWNEWESRAVKAGHAEYYLDENNVRQWRWKQ